MPNHATTQITGPTAILDALTRTHTEAERAAFDASEDERKERLAELGRGREFIREHLDMTERIVDFGMVIPEPDNIEQGACGGQHEPGVICWYEWNIDHWGTKWNGYSLHTTDHGDGTAEIRFETAWSHPFPVLEALSRALPDAELSVSYADEDLGSNLGWYVIRGGEIDGGVTEPDSLDEARDFAANLKYDVSYAELIAEWERAG